MFDPTKTNNNIELTSPFTRKALELALRDIWAENIDLFVFEAWRSPSRQNYLYEQGRSREGSKVTNSQAWQSWHQFGVAYDLVFKRNNRWSWEGDYTQAAEIMKKYGFKWGGDWGDKPHFEMTGKISLQEAKAITDQHGIQALWQVIQERTIAASKPAV